VQIYSAEKNFAGECCKTASTTDRYRCLIPFTFTSFHYMSSRTSELYTQWLEKEATVLASLSSQLVDINYARKITVFLSVKYHHQNCFYSLVLFRSFLGICELKYSMSHLMQ